MAPFEAARAATAEIGLAVLATTLSLVVIFVPVSFMSSISGRFLYQFGITAAVAVLVSLLVSFTLTPMMSARLLRGGRAARARRRRARAAGFYALHRRVYARLLALGDAPPRARSRAVAVAGDRCRRSRSTAWSSRSTCRPTSTRPSSTSASPRPRAPASARWTTRCARSRRELHAASAACATVLATVGGGFLGSVNDGAASTSASRRTRSASSRSTRLFAGIAARCDPLAAFHGNYTQRDVMQEVRGDAAQVPRPAHRRAQPAVVQHRRRPTATSTSPSAARTSRRSRGTPRQLRTRSSGARRHRRRRHDAQARQARAARRDRPRARRRPRRATPRTSPTALRLMVGGDEEVSRFRDAHDRTRTTTCSCACEDGDRNDPDTIARLYVPRARRRPGAARQRGHARAGADRRRASTASTGSAQVEPPRRRRARLRARPTASRRCATRPTEMNLPAGYTTRVSGRGRELERTFGEFVWAFLLSIMFMYMILASQFESLVHPLTILLSLPLSVPFALLSLWLTGNTLNLYSALGMLVLFGVVEEERDPADRSHEQPARGRACERLDGDHAGQPRPAAADPDDHARAGRRHAAAGARHGPGAEERRAIAVVVIGGQTLSLLLTLLVTPGRRTLFDDLGRRGAGAGCGGSASAPRAVRGGRPEHGGTMSETLTRREFVVGRWPPASPWRCARSRRRPITTDTKGLEAGEVKIPPADGEIPAYRAMPASGQAVPGRPGRAGDLRRPRAHQGHLPPARQARLPGRRARAVRPPGRRVEDHRHPGDHHEGRLQGARRAGDVRPRRDRRLGQGERQGRHGEARHHRLLLGRPHRLAVRGAQPER